MNRKAFIASNETERHRDDSNDNQTEQVLKQYSVISMTVHMQGSIMEKRRMIAPKVNDARNHRDEPEVDQLEFNEKKECLIELDTILIQPCKGRKVLTTTSTRLYSERITKIRRYSRKSKWHENPYTALPQILQNPEMGKPGIDMETIELTLNPISIEEPLKCIAMESTENVQDGISQNKQSINGQLKAFHAEHATKISKLAVVSQLIVTAPITEPSLIITIETVTLAYGIYQITRSTKDTENTESQWRTRKIAALGAKMVLRSTGMIVGGTVGQMLIPVPVLGAIVGSAVGGLLATALCFITEKIVKKIAQKKSESEKEKLE